MKVIICGGRMYWPKERFDSFMDEFHKQTPITLVMEGGAKGIDQLAREWCKRRKVANKTFPANWKAHGKGAGAVRIQEMLNHDPDKVIAFPGGVGTELTVRMAVAAGIEIVNV